MKEQGNARGARRMARWVGGRLSYANVMSTIAVFGVLAGGSAYAASKIGPQDIAKNAVRDKHIKKNQVKAKHVAKNAVRTPEIRDGSVTAEKLAEGVEGLQGAKGDPGSQGPKGDRGPVGPTEGTTVDSFGNRGVPHEIQDAETFTTTRPGQLLVMMQVGAEMACDTGSPWVWLRVDGVDLPGAVIGIESGELWRGTLFGITSDSRPAGEHMVEVAARCPFGTGFFSGGAVSHALTAVVLGG